MPAEKTSTGDVGIRGGPAPRSNGFSGRKREKWTKSCSLNVSATICHT
jgi:hypothetical protein